jgi:hypothetical protein
MTVWTGWPSGAADANALYNNFGVFVRQAKAFEQSSEENLWLEDYEASWPSYRQQIRLLWDASFLGGTVGGARLAGQAMCGVAPFIDELYDDSRWVVPARPSGSSDTYYLLYSHLYKYDDFAWGTENGVYAPSGSNDMIMDSGYTQGQWSVVLDSGYPLTTWVRLQGSGSFTPGSSEVGARTRSAFTEEKLDGALWSRSLYMASGSGSFDGLYPGRPFSLGDEVSGSFDIRIGSAPHRFLEIEIQMQRANIGVITPRLHGIRLSWLR